VWFAYLCMRGLSSVVKWRRWEAWFAPVDPGFLAIRRLQKSQGELAGVSFSNPAYNDIKAIVLLSMVMRKHHPTCPTTGGSLHKLFVGMARPSISRFQT
ncbi:unnamed protein product, partial [Aphanomyces euteiches]